MISCDNGSTWSPLGANLAVGDVPYRLSPETLSPNIAADGTIFLTGVGGKPR